MENKINIAELLKNCPKGMELDCASYDNVSFDKISDDKKATYPIFCYITDKEGNRSGISFTENGCESKRYGAKCVIFPKGKTTWEGFHRPFKDGDIIADGYFNTICIFKGEGRLKGTVDFYCGIIDSDEFCIKNVRDQDEHFGEINEYNFATEEEKAKLFKAIKDNGYRWNPETKTLEKLIEPKFKVGDRIKYTYFDRKVAKVVKIHDKRYELDNGKFIEFQDENAYEISYDKFNINTLKPFDKVLVRCSTLEKWRIQLFEKYDKTYQHPFICMGYNKYKQCIPYEGNEHLLDTTNNCDDFYKTWEK